MAHRVRAVVVVFGFLLASVLPLLFVSISSLGAGHGPNGLPLAGTSSSSWNPNVPCAPVVVRISDITVNQTQQGSFTASPFTPGITTTILNGIAKRWLTPGPTPPGWAAPGPPCTVTNSQGTRSLFVEIDGIGRSSLVNEDWSTLYDTTNGGNTHPALNTSDTTFNLYDPALVPNYSNSCTSALDHSCFGRIHAEIDHDWKAAGYCGTGTFCDNTTLATQSSPNSTRIDVQGFVYWDPANLDAAWHQFSGWELHPLTAWKLSSSPPPPPPSLTVSFTSSPSNPQLGQTVSFSGSVFGGIAPYGFSWNFGDGSAFSSSSSLATHVYVAAGSFSVSLAVTDSSGITGQSVGTVSVASVDKHDFAIIASPSLLSLDPAVSGSSNITIVAGSVFSRTLFLTVASTPGLTASISPTSVSGSGNAVLTVTAGAVGNYTATVTGSTRNGITHSVTVTVRIVDFSILVTPTFLTANVGVPNSLTVRVVPINGFSGTVSLTPNPSSGLSATLDPAVVAGGGASVLTISSSQVGNYTLTVFGNDGTLFRASATASVKVVDFTISASPTHVGPLFPGNQGTVTITVNGVNGFNGTVDVSLSPSSGLDASINPSTITGSGTATLAVNATSAGNYAVLVTGTSDSLSHQTTAVTVSVIDFSLDSPSAMSLNLGDSATSTINLASLNRFTGYLSLSSSVSPLTGLTVACDPSQLVLLPAGSTSSSCLLMSTLTGQYLVTITATSGTLVHTAVMTVNVVDFSLAASSTSLTLAAGSQGSSTITVSPINGFTGSVSFSTASPPGLNVALNQNSVTGSGTATLTVSGPVAGNYAVNITGTSGSLSHSVLVNVSVVDFAIKASPNNLAFNAGETGTVTLTVTGLNGFSGTVNLSSTTSPGLTATLDSSTLTGSGTVTLTLTSTTTGNYSVTVTATSGSLVHTVTITVSVGSFSMTVSPNSLSIVQGSSSSFTVTFASINGFSGTVDVSSSISRSSGVSLSCTNSIVTLSSGGTSSLTCSVTGLSNGNYTITITGTSGSLSQSSTVSIRVRQH